MKKLTIFFFSLLLLLTMFFQTGCSSDTPTDETDPIVIDIKVTNLGHQTVGIDSFDTQTSFTVIVQLTGLTENYSQINFYLGTDTNPVEEVTRATISTLAEQQSLDATITQDISTLGLSEGPIDLRIEAIGTNFAVDEVIIPIYLNLPDENSEWIDIALISPENPSEYDIGDMIEMQIHVQGNSTMFKSFEAYFEMDPDPIFQTTTFDDTLYFSFETEDLAIGDYAINFNVTDIYDVVKQKSLNFRLNEFIPTFEVVDNNGVGYELKSMVQTYDGGYVTVASDSLLGTRIVKYIYNKELEQVDVLWEENIRAEVGVAESVCEDKDYNGGVIIAGWRISDIDGLKDTWVRKVSSDDGSLIWNKHYGYNGIDDGATVIKKSVDDGYIIGGYTYNYYHADGLDGGYTEFVIPGENEFDVDSVTYNWDTGYDVRLLKIYSNGNEIWGHNHSYDSHRRWHDISSHSLWWDGYLIAWWVRTMGDQYITDLFAKDDGTYIVTGWNNARLYIYDGSDDRDMYYAHLDNTGGFLETMTWSEMTGFDISHPSRTDDFWGFYDVPGVYDRLNNSLYRANHLGTVTEDEIGYGIVESFKGYTGDVVLAGETYEIDDDPVTKSKFHDGWVVEFTINGDEDGALWEYSFGEAEVEDKAYGIDQTKDDGYIVTGYTTIGSDKATWTYKLNTELLVVWSKKFDVAGDDWGMKAIQTRDGGYITGGNVNPGGGLRARLIKINKLGQFNE
ncbi:MAG: hypothetical protein JXR69_01855 [Candidatus Delongbacteria bacterium]|nr:hypothetical protein [Candidatus Delongbacteria bacterium]